MYVEVVFVTLFKNRPFEAGWAGIGFWYLLEMANIDAETAHGHRGKGREVLLAILVD